LATGSDEAIIREQAEKILASGVLGRSRFYAALLEYLLACRERDHAPKEIEIAAEVFNRGEAFDPSQDSMVRVYAHNLRQKLQQFYADQGSDEQNQITLPKGEYRLVLAAAETPVLPAAAAGQLAGSRIRLALLVVACLAAGIFLDRLLTGEESAAFRDYLAVADSALWAEVTDDSMPVTIVVGDYFIFGELDRYGNIARMVREFDINSSRDLNERFMLEPEDADRYVDLDLTYLPSSAAFAIRDLTTVLAAAEKEIRVVAMSDLDTTEIRESHIVYVGFLSGLGMLEDFVFSASGLAVGETYDELVDLQTGSSYISEAALPNGQGSYRDYGLFSTMPGPGGNQFVFVTGMRDEGLMQTARAVTNPTLVPTSVGALTPEDEEIPLGYELLYEVAGLDRTNLDAMIVHTAPLTDARVAIGRLVP
jgi:hypothetical protein